MTKNILRVFSISAALPLLLVLASVTVSLAAPSSLNGRIAFASTRLGNTDIYTMNSDGSNEVRLTTNPRSDDFPTWSPDGQRIAYLCETSPRVFIIKIMNADGTNQKKLAKVVAHNFQTYPYERFGMSWSPDGNKIVFQDATDIYVIDANGNNLVNLTMGQFVNFEPSWSPDGLRVAFSRSIYEHGFYAEVYTMDVNGGNLTRITYCFLHCENRAPDWSPDGGRIALTYYNMADDSSYTLLSTPDGTIMQQTSYTYKPKWSPDGAKIVYYQFSSADSAHIWTMNRDGSGATKLTYGETSNFNPDWQPVFVNAHAAVSSE